MKVIFGLFMLWSSIAVATQNLTFRQAIDQMMQQNPALAQQRIESKVSLIQWKETKAAYYPQVDFLQSWSHSNNPVYAFGSLLNQQRFSEANFTIDSLNNPDPLTDVSSRVQAGWLIYDFGKREGQVQSYEKKHRMALLQEESTRLLLLQELVRRYYAVSLATHRLSVAEDAVRSAQARLKQASDRVQQGLVVSSDQLVAEVFYAQRLQEKIEAESQQNLSLASLDELLGTNEDRDVITDDLKPREFVEQPVTWWEEEMRQRKPELQIAGKAVEIAHSDVSIQKSNFLPSLQAWSNYEWHGESLDYSGNNWGVGVELRWNVFRGFADSQKVSAAKLQEQKAQQKQREIENSLTLQLKEKYFRFQSANKKLAVSAAAVKQAAESERIYADRYASGLVTIQDSLQAGTAYKETRLTHAQNLYELYVAYASLLSAAGKGEEIETIGVEQ